MNNFTLDIDEQQTLWQRWVYNSETIPDQEVIIHWVAGEEPFRWNYKKLIDTAKKYSAFIKAAGIERDQVCAIIIRHNPLFYPIYLGVSRTAALPAVLAYPNPKTSSRINSVKVLRECLAISDFIIFLPKRI